MKSNNKYNLLTCIAMIVGVVIGSGIFFKSDNILEATNGNILLGVIAFCIAAISIVFGCLTIAELAARTDKAGGVITYIEEAYSSKWACSMGWFQTLIYFPTIISVVCYIVGVYTCMLFGITPTLTLQLLIALIVALLLFGMHIVSTQLTGYFQTAATFIKLIPLILIGIAGFIFGDPSQIIPNTPQVHTESGSIWLSAIIPIVFAFDGWLVATSISHKVKNAKKNVPLALIIAPSIILIMYLLYFVGISVYLGPDVIRSSGDVHVEMAASSLLGPWAAKGILVFIIISVIATANGLMSALFQLPYSLSLRNMMPCSEQISKINKKWQIPFISYAIGLLLIIFWSLIHYITQKYSILPNSDISEIGITLNYILLIPLYFHVLKLGMSGEIKGLWRGKLNPIFASVGSLIILYIGLQNKLFILYIIICSIVLVSAYYYCQKNNSIIAEVTPE